MNADIDNPEFRSLTREISLGAQTLCSGLTALRKAEPAKPGTYYEAFFGLATGLERLCKIVIILDHALDHGGLFPTDDNLKKLRHDIQKLIQETKRVRDKHPSNDGLALFPEDEAVRVMTLFLCEFAQCTRYYNLDLLHKKADKQRDPISSWYDLVGSEVLRIHYTGTKRERDRKIAEEVGGRMNASTAVYFTKEDGTVLTDAVSMLYDSKKAPVIQKWGQFYALKVAHYLSVLIVDLENESHRNGYMNIPYLNEFLWPFRVSDRELKSRKTWSIYHS